MSHCTMLSKYGNCMHLLKMKNKIKVGCFLIKSGRIHKNLWAYLTLYAPISTYKFSILTFIHFLKKNSWESLIIDQSIFFLVIILLTLMIISLGNIWILLGENWCWSLSGLKGLIKHSYACWIWDVYSQRGATCHVGYLPSHIQRALVE